MNKEDRLKVLNDAQEKLEEAIELIEYAVEGSHLESEADSYIIAHLRNWCDGNNPYDATTIPKLIEGIEKVYVIPKTNQRGIK